MHKKPFIFVDAIAILKMRSFFKFNVKGNNLCIFFLLFISRGLNAWNCAQG